MQSSGYRIVDYLESITVLYSLLCESVLQAVRVYSQRLSYRLEDYRSYNQAYQIIGSNNNKSQIQFILIRPIPRCVHQRSIVGSGKKDPVSYGL